MNTPTVNTPLNVYVVRFWDENYGGEIMGVFSSPESAKQWIQTRDGQREHDWQEHDSHGRMWTSENYERRTIEQYALR